MVMGNSCKITLDFFKRKSKDSTVLCLSVDTALQSSFLFTEKISSEAAELIYTELSIDKLYV